MKKEYIKPNCDEQVMCLNVSILAGSLSDFDHDPNDDPFAPAPKKRTSPF